MIHEDSYNLVVFLNESDSVVSPVGVAYGHVESKRSVGEVKGSILIDGKCWVSRGIHLPNDATCIMGVGCTASQDIYISST